MGCGWGWAVNTLLGPERTTVLVVKTRAGREDQGLSFQARRDLVRIPCAAARGGWVSAGVGCGVVGWLLVEMCIVDASIFVVKLSRADGGCLGTRSR